MWKLTQFKTQENCGVRNRTRVHDWVDSPLLMLKIFWCTHTILQPWVQIPSISTPFPFIVKFYALLIIALERGYNGPI